MSARPWLTLQRAGWELVWSIGTLRVSGALAVLALAYVVAGAVTTWSEGARLASGLPLTWPYVVLASALVLDGVAGLLKAAPVVQRPDGGVALGAVDVRAGATLLARLGYLLLALGFTASLASRDRLAFRCAEGETLTASSEQFAGRDAPRPLSPGAFPVRLGVGRVRGGEVDPSEGSLSVELRDEGGRVRSARPWRPAWFGWGRFVRPVSSGIAVHYALSRDGGAPVEEAIAKLDLLPGGRVDSIRFEAEPYRCYLRLAGVASRAPALGVAVFRGKLKVAEGAMTAGSSLHFEGRTLRLIEAHRWARLDEIRDSGIPLGVLGLIALLAGACLRGWASLSRLKRQGTNG